MVVDVQEVTFRSDQSETLAYVELYYTASILHTIPQEDGNASPLAPPHQQLKRLGRGYTRSVARHVNPSTLIISSSVGAVIMTF
jgi:hypothetical protein